MRPIVSWSARDGEALVLRGDGWGQSSLPASMIRLNDRPVRGLPTGNRFAVPDAANNRSQKLANLIEARSRKDDDRDQANLPRFSRPARVRAALGVVDLSTFAATKLAAENRDLAPSVG